MAPPKYTYAEDTMALAWQMFDTAMHWEYKACISLLKGERVYQYHSNISIAEIYLRHACMNEILAVDGRGALTGGIDENP